MILTNIKYSDYEMMEKRGNGKRLRDLKTIHILILIIQTTKSLIMKQII